MGHIHFASVYFRFRDPTRYDLDKLSTLLHSLDGPVVICADTNARSVVWHSGRTNEKGSLIEAFLLPHSLTVHNCPSLTSTFNGPRGTSNIDVTFSRGLTNHLTNWLVSEDDMMSDHSLISFRLDSIPLPEFLRKPIRYRCDRADWDLSKIVLVGSSSSNMKDSMQVRYTTEHRCLLT